MGVSAHSLYQWVRDARPKSAEAAELAATKLEIQKLKVALDAFTLDLGDLAAGDLLEASLELLLTPDALLGATVIPWDSNQVIYGIVRILRK